jgi:hypothetical protein
MRTGNGEVVLELQYYELLLTMDNDNVNDYRSLSPVTN